MFTFNRNAFEYISIIVCESLPTPNSVSKDICIYLYNYCFPNNIFACCSSVYCVFISQKSVSDKLHNVIFYTDNYFEM